MKRTLLILVGALALFGCTLTTTGGIQIDWDLDVEIEPPSRPGPESGQMSDEGPDPEEVAP